MYVDPITTMNLIDLLFINILDSIRFSREKNGGETNLRFGAFGFVVVESLDDEFVNTRP